MAGGPPPRARLSLWFGGVKRFRDISSVGWRLPAVFHDRLTPANTQLRTADSESVQVKISSHFPPGRDRQGFQIDLHPSSTHRYARRLLIFYSGSGNYLSSCGSEITALDRTILPLFLFRSSSTAFSHIEPNASKTIPGRIRKMLWFLPVVPFLFRRWLRRSSALADQDVRRES